MSVNLPGYLASGTIIRSRFVTRVNGLANTTAATAYKVKQSVSGDIPVGVADVRVNVLPGSTAAGTTDPLPAATDGQPIWVYRDTEAALLEAGAAITAGQFLKPDSVGRGVPLDGTNTSTTQWYGARAEENASAAGQLIVVQVITGATRYNFSS